MSIKLHPRYFIVEKHKIEYLKLMIDFEKNADLTYTELLGILLEYIQNNVVRYMKRSERHPDDPEKKADEE